MVPLLPEELSFDLMTFDATMGCSNRSIPARSRPSGDVKIAIEYGPVEIVDLPMKNCDFPSFFVLVPGRVPHESSWNLAIPGQKRSRVGGPWSRHVCPTTAAATAWKAGHPVDTQLVAIWWSIWGAIFKRCFFHFLSVPMIDNVQTCTISTLSRAHFYVSRISTQERKMPCFFPDVFQTCLSTCYI